MHPPAASTSPQRYWLYGSCLVLLLPALLIHLGLMPLIEDEGIRATVAMEMEHSGDYWLPTLVGEYYYKKPPAYNWLLLAANRLTGWYSEWSLRLPTVLCLLLYAGGVFHFTRRHFDRKMAFLNAFLLLTCGRILFWDSMLALIDTCFSGVIFLNFMWVYHGDEGRRPWRFFGVSYLLISAAWMLKGLPAAVFQATTLVPYLAYHGRWRRLLSWPHLAGVAVFVLLVGGYYAYYWSQNPSDYLYNTLFNESAQRTAVNYGIGRTLAHLLTFPFEMVYHFLPWSLLLLYFLDRKIIHRLRSHPFVFFCVGMLVTNIAVYWLSVEVYPRYLLMLAPLFFVAYLYLHRLHEAENTWQYRTVGILLVAFAVGCLLFAAVPLFHPGSQQLPYWGVKTGFLLAALVPFVYGTWRFPRERLLLLVPILLLVRIGFNWFVLPQRAADNWGTQVRESTYALAERYRDAPLYVYRETDLKPSNTFYLSSRLGRQVLRHFDEPAPGVFYVFDKHKYPAAGFVIADSIKVRAPHRFLYVGAKKQEH